MMMVVSVVLATRHSIGPAPSVGQLSGLAWRDRGDMIGQQ
jgi:hypothetical protein